MVLFGRSLSISTFCQWAHVTICATAKQQTVLYLPNIETMAKSHNFCCVGSNMHLNIPRNSNHFMMVSSNFDAVKHYGEFEASSTPLSGSCTEENWILLEIRSTLASTKGLAATILLPAVFHASLKGSMCLQHLATSCNILQLVAISSRKWLCAICSPRSALQQGQSFMESFGYSDDSDDSDSRRNATLSSGQRLDNDLTWANTLMHCTMLHQGNQKHLKFSYILDAFGTL